MPIRGVGENAQTNRCCRRRRYVPNPKSVDLCQDDVESRFARKSTGIKWR